MNKLRLKVQELELEVKTNKEWLDDKHIKYKDLEDKHNAIIDE